MKRRELERELKRHGCWFYRHGSSHDIWLTPGGLILSIPRHREIKEPLARALIRDAKRRGG